MTESELAEAIFDDDFFKEQSLIYQLYRSGKMLDHVRISKGDNSIIVWPESYNKIRVGDMLSKDGDELIVTTISSQSANIEQFKTQTRHEYEREFGNSTHIDHVNQSQIAIGNNGVSQSQSNHVTLKTIKDNAFDIKPEDQELFHELVDQLQQFESGKISLKKDSFSKYGKLLKDYLPLGLQVGEFIHLLFFGH
ncbi:hypothetical protein [Levilactobacillus sp. HBUAS70063]|uniref:hypothetical protein n=2 Tax=Levilactobacillus TaxID=2767886 RepID=UPI003132C0C0